MEHILESSVKKAEIEDIRFINVSTLIIKITHRCNLDCQYCYENISEGEDMSIETFKELIYKIFKHSSKQTILIVFHGGEPTLVKNEWFIEAVEYTEKISTKYLKKARFSIQTNLFSIEEKKILLFKYLKISIGVSIDGPLSLGLLRGKNERVIENIKLVQSLGIKIGVLTTINHSNFNHFKEICLWLQESLLIKSFKANVVMPVRSNVSIPGLNTDQIFNANKAIIDFIIETRGEGLVEQNIKLEILRFFASKEELKNLSFALCRAKKCGAGREIISITTEGGILPCGRLQWNDSSYNLGGIQEIESISSLIHYKKTVNLFHSYMKENWTNCKNCHAQRTCSYGCQAFIIRTNNHSNIDCIPTKMRYDYYCERSTELRIVFENWERKMITSDSYTNYSDHSDHATPAPYSDHDDSWYDYDHPFGD